MLPEGVLSIGIRPRADFWQPQKNERKAELIKYWHQRAVLDRMNISTPKSCIQPYHGHFTAMPKRPKMCRSSSLSHLLFPRDFSRTVTDRDIINTPLEPLQPADVLLGVSLTLLSIFLGGESPENPNFGGVNRRFQAKRAKYWKYHIIENPASISTKFCTTMNTIKRSSSVVPISGQQIQDGGWPPSWKSTKIAISPQWFDWSLRNLVSWCKMVS